MPSLIISRDSHFYKVFPLQDKVRIGRSHKNDIVLEAAGVSRLHASIKAEGGHYFLTDEGSTNGTIVDGKRIRGHMLTPGATFRIHDFLFAFVEDLPICDNTTPSESSPESIEGAVPIMEKTIWLSPSADQELGLQRKVYRLFQMVSELHSALYDADIGGIIFDALFEITAAERGSIVLRQSEENLNFSHARGFGLDDASANVNHTIIEKVLKQGVCLHEGLSGEDNTGSSVQSLGSKSLLCVPLRSGDDNLGCLYLDHPDHTGVFSEVDRDLVMAVANHTAEALISGKKPTGHLNRATEGFVQNLKARGIIASSPITIKVFQDAQTIANYNVSVLIYGETGTGKEVIARYIHDESGRKGKFIARNCSAINESLFESELFGHERGAFTGANEQRPGMLELADRGTIFLDEIGDMPEQLQVKLLRALQEQEVWRVGGREPVKIDVRVISATHKDIKNKRNLHNFRDDFYYRLANVEITAPALRERKEDIGPLCDLILQGLSEQHMDGLRKLSISSRALRMLEAYDWPGNIRELRNTLLQIALRNDTSIIEIRHMKGSQVDFPVPAEKNSNRLSSLAEVERAHIIKALKYTNGNKSAAAKVLRMDRNRLSRRMKKLGIEDPVVNEVS